MSEQWRVCPSFRDYEVSDQGRVRRCTPGVNTYVGRIIVGYTDKDGYRCVLLRQNGRKKAAKVHRLVAEAFIGPIGDGMTVNHKNGIRDDNRLSNLEPATVSENTLHSFRVLGRRMHKIRAKGEAHGNSKLTAEKVREIRLLHSNGATQTDLADRFATSQTNISSIVRRKAWTHI